MGFSSIEHYIVGLQEQQPLMSSPHLESIHLSAGHGQNIDGQGTMFMEGPRPPVNSIWWCFMM